MTLDHILVPPRIKVRRVSVQTISGTDHRAVIAELVVVAGSWHAWPRNSRHDSGGRAA
jgi:hypothetical protein